MRDYLFKVESLEGHRVWVVEQGSNKYGETVTLKFVDRPPVKIWLEGDCCSNSYFTDRDQFNELVGATILQVEDRWEKSTDDGDGTTSWHFLVFVTNKGHITIDWRNDSNGYYDGWVCWGEC